MIILSEDLFNDDFEAILRECLMIIKERKTLRNEIHKIVEECANQIVILEGTNN